MDENLPENRMNTMMTFSSPLSKKEDGQPTNNKSNDTLMYSGAKSSSSSSSLDVMDVRLRAIQKSIAKATEEAFQRTNPTLFLESGGGDDDEDNKDENASFHLGMELFGSAEPAQMEKSIQESLQQLEDKLQTILQSLQQQRRRRGSEDENDGDSEAGDEDLSERGYSQRSHRHHQSSVFLDASVLQYKLSLLKQCSEIRQYIDESIALADPSYSSARSTDIMAENNHGEMDLVQAMRKLIQAEQAWEQAHRGLLDCCQSHRQERATDHGNALQQAEQEREWTKCLEMMEWLRQDIRNPKVEIIHQVQTLWQNCITLEPETIYVRGFQTKHNSSYSNNNNTPKPPLEQVYGVFQVLDEEQQHSLQKEMILPFAVRVYEQVLQPVLELHHKKDDKKKKNQARLVRWKFHESQQRGAASSSLTSSSLSVVTSTTTSSSSLGTVKSLEWTQEEEGRPGNDDITTSTNISLHENQTIAAWTETLQFLQRILVFIAEHVFFNRPELCRLFGQRLLGRPQVTNVLEDTMDLGSASRALQLIGKDDGLLMEPLVDLMMDSCLPDRVTLPNHQDDEVDEEEDNGLVAQLARTQSQLQVIVIPFLNAMELHGLLEKEEQDEHGMIIASPTSQKEQEGCRLREFVQNFMHHYIHHRHSLLLDQARSLILQPNDFHNTKQVGIDPLTVTSEEDRRLGLDPGLDLFLLHQSCISVTAAAVLQLCVACLDEAVDCANALASAASSNTTTTFVSNSMDHALEDLPATLYQAARQVLDLYRAIVPVRYGKEISQLPRTTAIFYSDCVYLAHHCHSLGLRYREKFPEQYSDLRRVCIFVDKVPLFRDMADKCMREMLDRQSQQVEELVKPRIVLLKKALQSNEIVAEWADAETALNAALYHLQHLAQQWKSILPQQTFYSALGFLAHVLFTLFLEPVLTAPDYSTDACEFVHDLFGKSLDRVQALLQLPSYYFDATNGSKSNNNNNVEAIVPTWNRLKAVGLFMDMTLNDVEVALSQGVFASITGQELSHLLTAVFDESPKQKELLKLVKQQQ